VTTTESQEKLVSFQRNAEIPGIELRSLQSSQDEWGFYSSEFEFLTPKEWVGAAWHRQQQFEFGPGRVLCAQPGEVYLASRVDAPGALQGLVVDTRVLAQHWREHGVEPEQVTLRAVALMTPEFGLAFCALADALGQTLPQLEADTRVAEFAYATLTTLIDREPRPQPRVDWSRKAAARLREYLHDECSSNLDLATLAAQSGLSRFQALRAFKRHYGLPPHAYQLRVRVGLAQRSLRQGRQPARVAAECGFVDQSHMTRHFKRLVGVTPAQYQRLGGRHRSPVAESGT
jgi:AraC-like DNA-binding protein